MTKKQLTTLKLFASGHPLYLIAASQQVSLSTIRSRLKAIGNTSEFRNACGIRHCYKRAKTNIYNPKQLNELGMVLYKY